MSFFSHVKVHAQHMDSSIYLKFLFACTAFYDKLSIFPKTKELLGKDEFNHVTIIVAFSNLLFQLEEIILI